MAQIPRWVVAYAVFMGFIPVLASVVALAAPGAMFGGPIAGAEPVLGLYLSRNAGLLVLAGLAVARRTAPLLGALFGVRLVVDLMDLAVTVGLGFTGQGPAVLIVSWLVFFTGPQVLALRALATPEQSSVPAAGR